MVMKKVSIPTSIGYIDVMVSDDHPGVYLEQLPPFSTAILGCFEPAMYTTLNFEDEDE